MSLVDTSLFSMASILVILNRACLIFLCKFTFASVINWHVLALQTLQILGWVRGMFLKSGVSAKKNFSNVPELVNIIENLLYEPWIHNTVVFLSFRSPSRRPVSRWRTPARESSRWPMTRRLTSSASGRAVSARWNEHFWAASATISFTTAWRYPSSSFRSAPRWKHGWCEERWTSRSLFRKPSSILRFRH